MRLLASFIALFLSLFSVAIGQGSGGPFLTAPAPTAVTLVGQQNTQTAQPSAGAPISQGVGSIILSGTRAPDSQSSSGALVLDTAIQSKPSATPAAGTTVTQTTTASRTAAGNIAPTKAPAWQSWLAVMIGGVVVAAGLM